MSEEGVVSRERPEGRREELAEAIGGAIIAAGLVSSSYAIENVERWNEQVEQVACEVEVVEAGGEGLQQDIVELEAQIAEEEDVLREFLAWYDQRFPPGQSKQLPGVALFMIAEKARAALAAGPPGGEGEE